MSGLITACRYGLKPLEFGHCLSAGHKEAHATMINYITGKTHNHESVIRILKKYVTAYPMYCLIAKKNGLTDPFAEKVVKAYWIGNSLLNKADSYKAHHSYHVYTVGSVMAPFSERLKELCRVSWAEVLEIMENALKVVYYPVLKKDNKYTLTSTLVKKIAYNKDLLPKAKVGDIVSVHWNYPVEVINQRELKNLIKYTQLTLANL
jgi:hypothetical protein